MISDLEQDDATLAARATLVALRGMAAHPRELDPDHVLLLPTLHPKRTEDVITVFAQSRNPISCISVEFSKTLVLGWWERDPSLEEFWMKYQKIDVEDTLRPYREQGVSRGREARFALVAGGEVTALSLPTCELWFSKYDFPLVSISIDPATGELESQGFAAVIRASRSKGAILDAVAI